MLNNFLDRDDFNLELIKQSFDWTNSFYYRDFIRSSNGEVAPLRPYKEPAYNENVRIKSEISYQQVC